MHFNDELRAVELHIHLDGAVRARTLYDLSVQRSIRIPHKNYEEFCQSLRPFQPCTLANYLEPFWLLLPIVAGDKEALMRIAQECVEDCAHRSGLCYVELRIAPHLLAGPGLDADAVTRIVLEAVMRAGHEHGIQVRLLLCILRNKPETAEEVLELAVKYKPHGVVGIDVAGDDATWSEHGLSPKIIEVFEQARDRHVHRTVHAGENSPAEAVLQAAYCLHAERIGHGYSVLKDPTIYEMLRNTGVHFEVCPTSSLMTGGVRHGDIHQHPVLQFATDGLSYSINTDGPLITGRWIPAEYKFCHTHLGMSSRDIEQSKLNAVQAAFLDSEDERTRLMEHVQGRT